MSGWLRDTFTFIMNLSDRTLPFMECFSLFFRWQQFHLDGEWLIKSCVKYLHKNRFFIGFCEARNESSPLIQLTPTWSRTMTWIVHSESARKTRSARRSYRTPARPTTFSFIYASHLQNTERNAGNMARDFLTQIRAGAPNDSKQVLA